jgi:hypothetical protein
VGIDRLLEWRLLAGRMEAMGCSGGNDANRRGESNWGLERLD